EPGRPLDGRPGDPGRGVEVGGRLVGLPAGAEGQPGGDLLHPVRRGPAGRVAVLLGPALPVRTDALEGPVPAGAAEQRRHRDVAGPGVQQRPARLLPVRADLRAAQGLLGQAGLRPPERDVGHRDVLQRAARPERRRHLRRQLLARRPGGGGALPL
ncbi:MAG: hypothetical protein AVDCRST_MAG41-3569, partial [uncultured Corynebacteriales bacterium]